FFLLSILHHFYHWTNSHANGTPGRNFPQMSTRRQVTYPEVEGKHMEIRPHRELLQKVCPLFGNTPCPIDLHPWPPTKGCKLTLGILVIQGRNNFLSNEIAW